MHTLLIQTIDPAQEQYDVGSACSVFGKFARQWIPHVTLTPCDFMRTLPKHRPTSNHHKPPSSTLLPNPYHNQLSPTHDVNRNNHELPPTRPLRSPKPPHGCAPNTRHEERIRRGRERQDQVELVIAASGTAPYLVVYGGGLKAGKTC